MPVKLTINQEKKGQKSTSKVDAIIESQGEIITSHGGETCRDELLSGFLVGEWPMLEEIVVNLLDNLLVHRVNHRIPA